MAEAPVKLVKVSRVKPAIRTAIDGPMFLSNIDLLFLPVKSVERILFYPALSPPHDFSSIVQTLQSSLSSALVHFYPLAGRLVAGQDDRPQIDCSDAGVEFVEASTDFPFRDLQKDDFQYKPFFKNLVHSLTAHEDDDDRPLFSVQVTVFGGDGLCVGFALNHVVADGKSIWHFMKSWAECSRGLTISAYPDHDRTLLRSDKLNNNKYGRYRMCFKDGIVIFSEDGSRQQSDGREENTELDEKNFRPDQYMNHPCRKFHLDRKMIDSLKEKATANGAAGQFSSFVSVAAHFWRCIIEAREVPPDESVDIYLLADSRSRINPPLNPFFFGNCVQLAGARTSARDLLNREMSFAAGLIQKAVNSCNERNLKAMVDWVECYEGINDLNRRYSVEVVASPRFGLYEIDYGWGKPLKVQAASFNGMGQMLVYPGRDEAGGFDISTCLPHEQMTLFQSLFLCIYE